MAMNRMAMMKQKKEMGMKGGSLMSALRNSKESDESLQVDEGVGDAESIGGGMTLTWPEGEIPELEGKQEGDTVELKSIPLDVTATVGKTEGGNVTISVDSLAYPEEVSSTLPDEENKQTAENLVSAVNKKQVV